MPEATFVGSEYAYDGPKSIDGGWTRVTLDNQGELGHDLILLRLLEGKTVDDVTAMLADDGAPPAWIDVKGGATAEPGSSASFVSNLEAGNYVMFSFGSAKLSVGRQFTVTGGTACGSQGTLYSTEVSRETAKSSVRRSLPTI